jgi:hypothetical protein
MLELKTTPNISIVVDLEASYFSIGVSEYAKFVGVNESTIRHRLENNQESLSELKMVQGRRYRLIPLNVCLDWLLLDKPRKLKLFIKDSLYLTNGNFQFLEGEEESKEEENEKVDFSDISIKQNQLKKKHFRFSKAIYLFETSSGYLKLGYSTNVQKRFDQIKRWSDELSVVEVVGGTIEQEQSIHRLLHSEGKSFGQEWYPVERKKEILKIMRKL